MSYRIIPALPTDRPLIRSIAQRTWPVTFTGILSPRQIDYMLERMYSEAAIGEQADEGHVFYLLAAGGTPVGYVSHQLDYLPGTTKIHKIYLLPEAQGKGYGRALIEYVERLARRAGQGRLRLDVNYQNTAVSFYEHLRFVKIERCNTDIGNGYLMEDWVLEKGVE